MRHFIAYHNSERMGRHLHEGNPLQLLTKKPVRHLQHHAVWFVVGEGTTQPKERELSAEEKDGLRKRLEQGETDIYRLAEEFGCSASQVAGIKAAMSR